MDVTQWRAMMELIIPKLLVKIQGHIQRFKILGPQVWDLLNKSILGSEDDPSNMLKSNFVSRFLIRNMSLFDSLQRDKSSVTLVSALHQQPEASQLRPRISAIEPLTLSNAFKGDLSLSLQSTANFEAS